MNTVLITGGAGFIGSNFVRLAHRKTDCKLIVLDALTYAGDLERISDLINSPRIEFINGDICNRELLEEIFIEKNVSGVVHFAAESHVDRSIQKPLSFVKTNVEGTINLLLVAGKAWLKKERNVFLHVSTDEVYGSLGLKESPFSEKSPYCPGSPYSASKAASDHFVKAWHNTYGLPAIITNCSNNYGPWQHPEKLIPLMILNSLEGRELPVYGDGLQIRDWLHVEDHCEALLILMEKGKVGETYNIGGNNEKDNLSVVKIICDTVDIITGKTHGISRKLIRHVNDRPGHDFRYAINNSKIRKELGWKPRYKLEDSLYSLIEWYIKHKDWADRIRSGDYQNFYARQYENI